MRTRFRSNLFCSLLASSVLLGCPGGKEKTYAMLDSPLAPERADAVSRLGESGSPEDLIRVTRMARDPAGKVRAEVARALGKSEDPRVIDLLGELLTDSDVGVQAAAAESLATLKQEKARAYLLLQYGRGHRDARESIVAALAKANVPGAMAAAVAAEANTIWDRNLSALSTGTLAERVAAAEELGESGRPDGVARLAALLTDNQVLLAAAAVRGLGHAGDKRMATPLASLLKERFPELREAAVHALGELGEVSVLPQLRAVALERSTTSPLALSAILSLPVASDTNAALCEVALAASEEVAALAARAMRERGGCPTEALEEGLTRGKSLQSTLVALVGLGGSAHGLSSRLVELYPTLTDSASQALALRALGELGNPAAAPLVRKVYDEIQPKVARQREDWVAPKKGASAAGGGSKAELLLQRVQQAQRERLAAAGKRPTTLRMPAELVDDVPEASAELLAACLRAMGQLRAPDALQILKGHASNSSDGLRQAAWLGLAAYGGEGLVAAADGLWEPDRATVAPLAEVFASQGEPGQRALLDVLRRRVGELTPILEALTKVKVLPEAAPVLEELVASGGSEAALAAELLGQMRAARSAPVLVKALDDKTTAARRSIVRALGEVGDAEAAPALVRELFHDSPDIRAEAALALGRLRTDLGTEALDALKGDYYRRVREAASAALFQRAAKQ